MSDSLDRQREMVARFPDRDLPRFSLGKALFDLGRYGEAEIEFREALKRRPDWMAVRILLGRCALQQGHTEIARREWTDALQLAREQGHEGPEAELMAALEDLDEADGSGGTAG